MARQPNTNRTRKGQRTRATILGVAAKLFNERGYHRTSLSEIAEMVGIRKASIYHYFQSKEEILVDIHEEMIDLIIGKQESRRDDDSTASEMLLGMMQDLVGLMETHPGHLRIFFEHYRELEPEAKLEIGRKRDHYQNMLREVLLRGSENGEFEIENLELASLAVLGVCNWTYQWFRPDGPLSAVEVAEAFYRTILNGISQRNG